MSETLLPLVIAGSFQPTVEYPHPSEDGEALQTTTLYPVVDEFGPISKERWFAVYTTCRHEKRVAQHLTQRGIEHFLPLYRADRKWRDGSRVTLELPLFPCYLFVRIGRSERVSVLSIPGAVALVGGTGGGPATVPGGAIEALRTGLREGKIVPHELLRVGEMAVIRSGAFAGMRGVILRKKGSCRVVLTLEQIMQSIAVEVDEEDLESVAQAQLPRNFSRQPSQYQLQETL